MRYRGYYAGYHTVPWPMHGLHADAYCVALCCWAGAEAEPLSETVCHLCAAARDRFATSMSGGHWALSTNAVSSSRAASTAFGDTRTTTTRCIVRPQRQTSPDRQSVQHTPGTFSNSTQRIVGRSARSRTFSLFLPPSRASIHAVRQNSTV